MPKISPIEKVMIPSDSGREEVTVSSGNVFADLGLPNAGARQAKAELALRIEAIIEAHHWTQAEAAKQMGLTQPNVSDLLRGRLQGFSLDRLLSVLNALGQDVDIRIQPRESGDQGRIVVTA